MPLALRSNQATFIDIGQLRLNGEMEIAAIWPRPLTRQFDFLRTTRTSPTLKEALILKEELICTMSYGREVYESQDSVRKESFFQRPFIRQIKVCPKPERFPLDSIFLIVPEAIAVWRLLLIPEIKCSTCVSMMRVINW